MNTMKATSKRSLVSKAKRQNIVNDSFKKRSLHLLWDKVSDNDLNDTTREEAKKFFRNYEFKKLDDAGIIRGLETRLTGSYTNAGIVDGLILLDYRRSEAEAMIKEYRDIVVNRCVDIKNNYSEELAIIQRKRIAYFTTPEDTAEAIYSTVGRDSINEEVKGVKGFQLHINDDLYIYTKSFGSFLLGKYDFLSKTVVSRIEAILKRLNKNDAVKANTILSLIIGKRKSSEITGTKKVEKGENYTFPSIDSNRQNSAEFAFLDFSFIKSLNVHSRVKTKLNKELKKVLYQQNISIINKYYTNDDLNEAINYDYLIKYKVMVNAIELQVMKIDDNTARIQVMIAKNDLDEFNGADHTYSPEELELKEI